jgi:hypothetical protein
LVFGRLSNQLEVLLGHLPRGLYRLPAAAREEHLVQVAGRCRRQPIGQLDGRRVSGGPDRKEGQLARLGGRDLYQLDASVSGLYDKQA